MSSVSGRAKYREIASELEAEIVDGQWPDDRRLPGVRQVAERYKVATGTAARALEVLIGKGLIESHERSGIFRVLSPPSVKTEHWAACLRITPGPWQRSSKDATIQGFAQVADGLGVRMSFDAIPNDLDLSETGLRRTIDGVKSAGISGLFFIPSRLSAELAAQDERFLVACRDAALPVVLIDRNLRGDARTLEWDLVCEDDLAGGLMSAAHLYETGRTRLGFVLGSPVSSHNERLAGFLLAHHLAVQRGLVAPPAPHPLVLQYPEDPSDRRAYRSLCDRVIEGGVDGVVCYHDRIAIGLAIELLTRGRGVPGNVALTGFDDQSIGREFALGITTYAYPSGEIALEAIAAMRRRIKDPAAPPIRVVVPGRLIVRESSAPAQSNGRAT
jgi:LacI family transcriptional regulator